MNGAANDVDDNDDVAADETNNGRRERKPLL